MHLLTLGKVRLENCTFSRPKPLLLLSYVTLEGPQERRKLAELFWEGDTQKNLGKLSVVLSQFKKEGAEVFPDKSGIDPLPSLIKSDVHEFLEALEQNHLTKALEIYQGPFLHDLGKSLDDLEIGDEILDWVLEKREFLADKAQKAMLELAEQMLSTNPKEARELAERAYQLSEAPEMEPQRASHLQHVLAQTQSILSKQFNVTTKANLDELSEHSRKTFLCLSLQGEPNLTIIRNALKLSLSDIAEAREALLFAGLIDQNTQVLAPQMADRWLAEHPTEWLPLLLALARATPPEQAFNLYQSIYEKTQGFGGVGDFVRARAAYTAKAKSLMDKLEFAQTAELLAQLRGVEKVVEAEPETESRFLEAYALERMGRFKESFEIVQSLLENLHNPNMTALKSGLLWRLGKSDEAKTAAESVIQNGLDWMWARGMATNTLGYLSSSSGYYLDAASHFKKSAVLFQTAGAKDRWAGSLNNYANELNRIAEEAHTNKEPPTILENKQEAAANAYQEALDALDKTNSNPLLRARIMLNLGFLWDRQQNWQKAEAYYLQAIPIAEQANALELVARLQLNLGLLQHIQKQDSEAKVSLTKSVETAAKAGEPFIQGLSLANLARLNNDPDSMEIGLELLEQSGHIGSDLEHFQETYIDILKRLIEQANIQQNHLKKHLYEKKLKAFYQQIQPESRHFEIDHSSDSQSGRTEAN